MKVLANATPLVVGGGMQVGANFLRQALASDDDIEWHFALSRPLADEVGDVCAEVGVACDVFTVSPARNRGSRQRLARLEREIAPDAVFTILGPAYVDFDAPHLLGCTNAWVTHATLSAYRTLRFPGRWVWKYLSSRYKGSWFRRADAWVTETEASRQDMGSRLRLPVERVSVVPNNCGPDYHAHAQGPGKRFPAERRVRLLCFAAPYPHKRVELVPDVARALIDGHPDVDFEFVVTLPPGPLADAIHARAQRLRVESRLVDVGRVPLAEGPDLTASCDVSFLPTILETFSATFPEAMAMGLPIVTSDLGFLRDVCGDAATYFRANDATAAASAIAELLGDEARWDAQVAAGRARLAALPDPAQKYERYCALLRQLVTSSS